MQGLAGQQTLRQPVETGSLAVSCSLRQAKRTGKLAVYRLFFHMLYVVIPSASLQKRPPATGVPDTAVAAREM